MPPPEADSGRKDLADFPVKIPLPAPKLAVW
jgi:hypothetical protein